MFQTGTREGVDWRGRMSSSEGSPMGSTVRCQQSLKESSPLQKIHVLGRSGHMILSFQTITISHSSTRGHANDGGLKTHLSLTHYR